eukprot:scaffold37550_cov20-Prasinocladus_malaysianus.AAC.1
MDNPKQVYGKNSVIPRIRDVIPAVRVKSYGHCNQQRCRFIGSNDALQVYGEDSTATAPFALDNGSAHALQRGRVDEFELQATDVGPVERIRVWHDGSGRGAAWYLDMVRSCPSISHMIELIVTRSAAEEDGRHLSSESH